MYMDMIESILMNVVIIIIFIVVNTVLFVIVYITYNKIKYEFGLSYNPKIDEYRLALIGMFIFVVGITIIVNIGLYIFGI